MIVLEDARDFESYCAKLEDGGMIAGLVCDRCRSSRLHGHGEYQRKGFILENGTVAPLPIRRVRCEDCGRAPSLVPVFAATEARAAAVVVEEAAARYLAPPEATYRSVAAWLGTAHSTVHRWVTRLGGVALAALLGPLLRLRPDLDPLALLPKLVPDDERKARSPARLALLRTALQVLVAGRRCAEELARGVPGAPRSVLDLCSRGVPHMT